MAGHVRELALRECHAFWNGYLSTIGSNWLSRPDDILLASQKIRQLHVALQAGLPVPPTIATNSANLAREFIEEHVQVAIKSIGTSYSVHPDGAVKLYTRRLDGVVPFQLLDGLRTNPLIFQRYIAKRREIRVTVVGDQVFAVSVDLEGLQPDLIEDVRKLNYAAERGRFSVMQPDLALSSLSLKLCRELNLGYAGLDWMQDQSGKLWFLEINPLGSFKWSELVGAHDISQAIATILLRKAHATDS